MLRLPTCVLLLVAKFSLHILIVSSTKYLVTLPKEPHYDSEVVATVTAVGVPPENSSVSLYYKGWNDYSNTLNSTEMYFHTDEVKTWRMVFPRKQMQDFGETSLYFEISDGDMTKDVILEFNENSGYIFIQTDKPIYNPRQTVKFRIIAVDEEQRLTTYPLKVDIKNPANIIVDRRRYTANEAFTAQTFELPREATLGNWTISANLEGLDVHYSAQKTVSFEIREYVLPRFSTGLTVNTDVITRDTTLVSLIVSGTYVYGRDLQGDVELQLGTWDEDNGVQLVPHRFTGRLRNGQARANFDMQTVFPMDEDFPQGKQLYVSVIVTEKGSGEKDTIVDTSTFIAHPYYQVDFSSTDQYFKPGFNYTLRIDVKTRSGVPAPWVLLIVEPTFEDGQGAKIETNPANYSLSTNAEARAMTQFRVPENTAMMELKVGILDIPRFHYDEYKYNISKVTSDTNQYMQVAMVKPIKSRRDGLVSLLYTADSSSSSTATQITVQVLSKGKSVYTTSTVKNPSGISTVSLPKALYREVSPSMRIVAYYHATLGGHSEFVVDSLLVDTVDKCIEELELYEPSGRLGSAVVPKLKDRYELEVGGGENMMVGLVAVDEAVFLLNDKQTLTRELLFQEMGRHDQGTGEGDGKTFDTVFQNSGLHHVVLDTEQEMDQFSGMMYDFVSGNYMPPDNHPEPQQRRQRPQTVRKYFPESWLFQEIRLDSDGYRALDLTLPDSITTWNFMAVGVSEDRGVCVSAPHRLAVEKLFFTDVRVPYKVRRLEEVKAKIAIYNYWGSDLQISGVVTGGDGMCLLANSQRHSSRDEYVFSVTVPRKDVVSEEVKIIPLRNGELTLTVDLQGSGERDVVERKLYVVAEGLPVHKSITFVLDPEAKHVSNNGSQTENITVQSSFTLNNTFDLEKKEQTTTIDLALPEEVVMGTESCHISAFGDLMADIITHTVVQSKSLVDQPLADAEEVLGDLGPTVHALLYLNESGLANEELAQKGRRFVSHSVARLLKYRDESGGFRLTPKSELASWLTAIAMKQLCYASNVTFVDQERLIHDGFTWLAERINDGSDEGLNGTVEEVDWRLSEESSEASLMLSSEVLIAIQECSSHLSGIAEDEDHLHLKYDMVFYLEDHIHQIQQSAVLAKAAYALVLFEREGEESTEVLNILLSHRRENQLGQSYWADEEEADSGSVPFWYQLGAKASSVEATAYSLLVLLARRRYEHVDAVADWLVSQRKENGAFIGAMDSTVAIQALSRYSLMKREQELLQVDLSCNVSTERTSGRQTHSFKFTQQNATSPESVNNVPVGQKLEVLTKGQGLGQMHVNVEYNIPVDKNADCDFNVTVNVTRARINGLWGTNSNPVCDECGIGCDDRTAHEEQAQATSFARVSRSAGSKPSICMHVCLQYKGEGSSSRTSVEMEMFTGYLPIMPDIERIANDPGVRNAEFIADTDVLVVQYDRIGSDERTCFGLRAYDDQGVGRPLPASLIVKQAGLPQPSCFKDYDPPRGEESLQVYCADISHSNKGECRCTTGICSTCLPDYRPVSGLRLGHYRDLACNAEVGYQLELTNVDFRNHWAELEATVILTNKSGSHSVHPGDSIKLVTPRVCVVCPFDFSSRSEAHHKMYLLSSDVERLVDRKGQTIYRYLLDEKSTFLRVSESGPVDSVVPIDYLTSAFLTLDSCSNRV